MPLSGVTNIADVARCDFTILIISDDKVPLNPPDSGSSTPDTSNSDEREIRSLLGKRPEGETTETPPPYSEKSEDPDKELPASSASCNLDEPESEAQVIIWLYTSWISC